jgi:hypothetical protein
MPLKVTFGGAYAIDRQLIKDVAADLGIERDEMFFAKLNIIEAELLLLLEENHEELKRRREEKNHERLSKQTVAQAEKIKKRWAERQVDN